MSGYEYEVLTFRTGWKGFDYAKIKDQLNELGSQGWRIAGSHDSSVGGGAGTDIVIILERARG